MAIPERNSRNGTGASRANGTEPSKDETETFTPIDLDAQFAAEFEEADDYDELHEGPATYESELVGHEEEPPAPAKPSTDSSAKTSKESVDDAAAPSHKTGSRTNGLPKREKKAKTGQQPIEIDPKTKKLLPFGSSKKVLRTGDFEPRKNIRREQTIARYGVLALASLLVLVAGYQAIFPAKPLTKEEVYAISLQATNYTNFPVESGRGYATDFMRAYLTMDPNSPSASVMNYYYSGSLENSGSSSSSSSTRTATGSYNQTILYGPTAGNSAFFGFFFFNFAGEMFFGNYFVITGEKHAFFR